MQVSMSVSRGLHAVTITAIFIFASVFESQVAVRTWERELPEHEEGERDGEVSRQPGPGYGAR